MFYLPNCLLCTPLISSFWPPNVHSLPIAIPWKCHLSPLHIPSHFPTQTHVGSPLNCTSFLPKVSPLSPQSYAKFSHLGAARNSGRWNDIKPKNSPTWTLLIPWADLKMFLLSPRCYLRFYWQNFPTCAHLIASVYFKLSILCPVDYLRIALKISPTFGKYYYFTMDYPTSPQNVHSSPYRLTKALLTIFSLSVH